MNVPAPAVTPAAGAPVAPVVVDPSAPATTPVTPEPIIAAPAAPAPEAIGIEPVVEAPAAPLYGETGDPGLDIALDFIGGMGLGPTHPAVQDAVNGKFERLEAALEAMGDKSKGYQRYLALAKDAYTRTSDATAATQTAVTTVVTEVAGSPEQWAAIKEWAGKNADPAEKEAINAMLTAGPVQARAAAVMLDNAYRAAGGTIVNPAPATKGAAGNAPTGNGALSPADYTKAIREARATLGSRFDGSKEYADLKARRMAWRP